MPSFIPARSYTNPLGRVVGLNTRVSVDMGNLPTLPDRMNQHLKERLVFHLRDTCEGIIEAAKLSLWRPGDFPEHKHGVDTGRLRESLTYHLVTALMHEGVYYDLLSDDAEYWQWVEFGHWVVNAKTPWFWPGYHFLEGAIQSVGLSLIMRSLRAAWHDTVIVLAKEARVAHPGTGRIGPSALLGR